MKLAIDLVSGASPIPVASYRVFPAKLIKKLKLRQKICQKTLGQT